MIKWLAFKKAAKRAWIWTKTHWYLPIVFLLLLVAFLIWAVFRNGMFVTMLYDVMENSRNSYDKQIDTLEGIHREEVDKKNKLIKDYLADSDSVGEDFAGREEELSREKEEALRKLMEESAHDPDKLAKEIAKLWGIDENG